VEVVAADEAAGRPLVVLFMHWKPRAACCAVASTGQWRRLSPIHQQLSHNPANCTSAVRTFRYSKARTDPNQHLPGAGPADSPFPTPPPSCVFGPR